MAVEDLNRLRVLKEARHKYEMRFNAQGRTASFQNNQRRRRMEHGMRMEQQRHEPQHASQQSYDSRQLQMGLGLEAENNRKAMH